MRFTVGGIGRCALTLLIFDDLGYLVAGGLILRRNAPFVWLILLLTTISIDTISDVISRLSHLTPTLGTLHCQLILFVYLLASWPILNSTSHYSTLSHHNRISMTNALTCMTSGTLDKRIRLLKFEALRTRMIEDLVRIRASINLTLMLQAGRQRAMIHYRLIDLRLICLRSRRLLGVVVMKLLLRIEKEAWGTWCGDSGWRWSLIKVLADRGRLLVKRLRKHLRCAIHLRSDRHEDGGLMDRISGSRRVWILSYNDRSSIIGLTGNEHHLRFN